MADKQAQAPAKKKAGPRLGKYFRDTWGELKKIVWPSRKQVWNNIVVVLTMIVIFAVVIWGLDTGFSALRNLLLSAF